CGPDFRFRRIEVFENGMQSRRLAGSRGPADEEQSVRLGNCVLKLLDVARRESDLVERTRLAGCKNPHDDIFDTACRRNGRDTQFDVERAELLELDLSVLRLALLRNVEVAHDLDARRDRRAI